MIILAGVIQHIVRLYDIVECQPINSSGNLLDVDDCNEFRMKFDSTGLSRGVKKETWPVGNRQQGDTMHICIIYTYIQRLVRLHCRHLGSWLSN